MSLFSLALLHWFDQHGRKNLPWQHPKTPYRVWISEIMLQQTQVHTVIPYFERFIKRFPNIETLALASQDEVLHYWSGLGYYSRARNLHTSAKRIMEVFQGKFPDEINDLLQLPGIGRSTAGAILSIAFQKSTPILDGNVKRILARYHGVTDPINTVQAEYKLWDFAVKQMPDARPGDYTQAVMDFGATFCTRAKPKCVLCPLQAGCEALLADQVNDIPRKLAPPPKPIKAIFFLIVQCRDAIFLEKRPGKGVWAGLWSFPEYLKSKHTKISNIYKDMFYEPPMDVQIKSMFRHTFSHYHIDIHPIVIKLAKQAALKKSAFLGKEYLWYKLKSPPLIGLPKPIKQLLDKIS